MARSDLVRSAYRYLYSSGVPLQLVAENLIGFDTRYPNGWVFRSETDGLPFSNVENSGKGAITLYSYDEWSASSPRHSNVFPRLHVAIFSDVTRDANRMPLEHDAVDRVKTIHERIHPLFHDSANQIHTFDDLFVISTVAGSGLSIGPVPQADGVMRGDVVYDISLF